MQKMRTVSYFDFDTSEGREEYQRKAERNIGLFTRLFGIPPDRARKAAYAIETVGPNADLMKRISDTTGIDLPVVQGANCADETLNTRMVPLACTSIARGGIIGQTLDLFSIDLCVVHEDDFLYVTMPPYLAMMGMGPHIACCINHISGPVQGGTPVSHLRRDVLRQKSLGDAKRYLESVERTTTGNYLLTDGTDVIDIEVTSKKIREYRLGPSQAGPFFCHTNHLLTTDVDKDKSCPRLARAVELLKDGCPLTAILDDKAINLEINYNGKSIGFGTLISVVMDVKAGTMSYRDPSWKQYVTMRR